MRKVFCFLFAITISVIAFSQSGSDIKLPVLTPPSPEAAAINKNGQLSVGMMSGAANASIPLYEIKLGGVTFPIALNYASNGMKVDEVPSRVGMNWTLSPTGVVSRIMHGAADDQTPRKQPYAAFPAYDDSLFDYMHNISQALSTPSANYEAEPDEFRYNAPGISGKFILKDNGDVLEIPYSTNKITVSGGPWGGGSDFNEITITNTEGVKYYFGGTGGYERTSSIGNGQYSSGVHFIRTAFFLKKVVTPTGDSILFNYNAITFAVETGKINSLSQVVATDCSGGCPLNDVSFSESTSTVEYQTIYLDSITSSRGEIVTFNYESRPDNVDDKRVTAINIFAGDFHKTYTLGYIFPLVSNTGYPGTLGDDLRRYYLSEVAYTVPAADSGYSTLDTLRYSLTYQDTAGIAPRLSYAQDHLGFYNGQNNSTMLVHYENEVDGYYSSANRDPNFTYAVKGMLSRITFPTGGYEEMEYEGNSDGSYGNLNTNVTVNVSGSGDTASNGSPVTKTYYSIVFKAKRTQTVTFSIHTGDNPGYGASLPPTVMATTYEVQCITDEDRAVTSGSQYYNDNWSENIELEENKVYQIKIEVEGIPYAAFATITYDSAAEDIPVWQPHAAPGVRVKSIVSYDPVSNKYNRKYYKYGTLQNPDNTSGVFIYTPVYSYVMSNLVTCSGVSKECRRIYVSSISINNLYLFDGLAWGYSHVLESDDPNFANGGIEHIFLAVANNDYGDNYYSGSIVAAIPLDVKTYLQNYETETNVFDKNMSYVKRTLNYYRVDSTVNNKYRAVMARERVSYLSVGLPYVSPSESAFYAGFCYDINTYQYISNWIQLDSTVVLDSSGSQGIKTKTVYTYGSASNMLPAKTEVVNSKGETIATEMKYPTDSTGVTVYGKMATNNIISPVISTTIKNNTVAKAKTRTEYYDWYPSSPYILIAPKKVYTQKSSGAEESRLQYAAYDNTQNLQEVYKENGQHITYIWAYDKRYPIAEFRNAGIADSIAFTSFETSDGKGYWAYSGTPGTDATSPTGKYCYDLDNGNITRNVNSGTDYYITFWLKNSSGTASVNGNSATQLVERNGWKCYQYAAKGSSTITISGSGTIDELRMFPIGSFVTSYTYRPFFGVTTQNSPNNQISYYEYDSAARLTVIRNMDRNVVKQFEYRYKKTIYPCPDTSANWGNTGIKRCVKTNDHFNNNTGEELAEQINTNNCSATYLQIRWVSLGTTGQCNAVTCTGDDKRVINGTCTAGTKVLIRTLKIADDEWQCTYHYVWPDGFVGGEFTEVHETRCDIEEI